MPRYHFHTIGVRTQTDSDGVVLSDIQAARVEARRFAGEFIRDNADSADFGDALRVEVTDEAERTLFRMEFREFITDPRAA